MKNKSYVTVLTIVLLLATLIPLFSIAIPRVAAAPTASDLYEPDNIYENATAMSNDVLQQHNIYPSGDVDWLELRIDGAIDVNTKVIVETFPLSSGDTDMYLYSLDLTRTLAHNDDKASGDHFSKISIDLTPGIYYVKVEGKGLVFDYTVIASSGRLFQKTYGDGYAQCVRQTSDRGYILAASSGGFCAIKTDSGGNVQWQNTYGGGKAYCVQQTSDGGYILSGYNGSWWVLLVKTDSSGTMQWQNTYYAGTGTCVQQTSDGGYILSATMNAGLNELVKVDSSGNVQWQKVGYGGSAGGQISWVQQTSDGGYILTGCQYDWSTYPTLSLNVLLVKTDSGGNVQWQNTYGRGSAYSVQQASDGGYILSGYDGSSNAVLVKTGSGGTAQWQKTYGSGIAYSARQTLDGGYILGCRSGSPNIELVKTDSGGNVQWQNTYGSGYGFSAQQTSDGGYVVVGQLTTNYNVFLAKTDVNGNSPACSDIILDEGTSLIPKVVYTILSDPMGDGSYNELIKEKTNSWDFTLSAEATVDVGFEAKASFLGSGVESSKDFSASIGGGGSKYVEVTTTQHWSSNTISDDANYIGPGYGDTYVGDAWLLHWRIVDRTFPNGTRANIVEYGPTTETGFILSAYEIKNGAVPEPYKSQMLALNPADDNYISSDEAQTLSFVKTETISGGIPYDESYSRTETSTRTFTISARMKWSTAETLGFTYGPIEAGGKVTVAFSLSGGISNTTSETTKTRTGFHIYDDNGPDQFQVTVWYNPVFGTYLFNASGRNIDLHGSSNPRELWDNQAPTASNVRIVPSSPKTTDILTLLYDYSDADGDPESGTQIWWFKGISHQAPYDNQHQIPAGVAKKGENWLVAVRPSDGIVYGYWQLSPWITIANSAPEASNLYISPTHPVTTDYLTANYHYYDIDGDPESGSQIRWYKNTILQTAYNDVRTVPASATSSGENWYFTIKPKDGTTFGNTVTSNTVQIDDESPGGGCPYIYTWNGQAYIKDNNILPASETGNGTDVTDYYKLEQQLTPVASYQHTSTYTLEIREFESEIDYIDQVKLIAVDHSAGTSIAVTPEGQIVTYMNPSTPLSCVDDEGIDRLDEISTVNGNVNDDTTFFQGYNGDWLLLNFGRVAFTDAKLILRDDQKCCDVCIEVQVPDSTGNWQTVETLHPRDSWSMEAVNLAAYLPRDGDFIVRLLWTAPHRLDYVGLDTSSEAPIKVTSVGPTVAVHSALGNVRAELLLDDEQCVQLVNGQWITFAFRLPDKTRNVCRDFLFCTNGYYYSMVP